MSMTRVNDRFETPPEAAMHVGTFGFWGLPREDYLMHVLTFSQARAELKQTMDDVCRDHEPAIITRQRGEPVVLLSLEDYNGMNETLYLTASPKNASRLRASIAQHQAGQAVTKELNTNEQAETDQQR